MLDHSRLLPLLEYRETAEEPAGPQAAAPGTVELGAMHIERVDLSGMLHHRTAWADLCERALEPNIFLEPGFALPLLDHVHPSKQPRFLLVWEENGPASFGRLIGLFPLERHRRRRHLGVARGFTHKQMSSGTPLVDARCAPQVLSAMLQSLAGPSEGIDALIFTGLAQDGRFFNELRGACLTSGRQLATLDEHQRAVLRRPDRDDRAVLSFVSAKHRKERARQFRRLSEIGVRNYTSARNPSDVALAAERFLALEHSGWKGARGTALLADPALATFTRAMTLSMASEGKCRIDAIEIDGRPVAMGVVLVAADRAYFWKTAFDETHATLSPGVQFSIELTKALIADPALASTDSCAIANHPMIDRLWPDRRNVTDVILAVVPGNARRFQRSLAIEKLRRGARLRAKTVWLRMRRLLGR